MIDRNESILVGVEAQLVRPVGGPSQPETVYVNLGHRRANAGDRSAHVEVSGQAMLLVNLAENEIRIRFSTPAGQPLGEWPLGILELASVDEPEPLVFSAMQHSPLFGKDADWWRRLMELAREDLGAMRVEGADTPNLDAPA